MARRLVYSLSAAGTDLTNSTADTALASYAFPACFFQNTKRVEFLAVVRSPTTTGTTTLTLKGKFGGTTFYTSAAVDQADGDVSVIRGSIFARDADSSGTAVVEALGADPDATGTIAPKVAAAVISSLDFTAALTLSVTGTWSAADGNHCQAERFEIWEEV